MTLTKADQKVIADLRIQALMFDMVVDIETASLEPKKDNAVPVWIRRWQEKQQSADRQPEDYEGGEDRW